MRILFAEDERDLNRIVTQRLEQEGYSVDSCLDGKAAIDCLACADYDAIILDIMMPRADGYEVLRTLRAAGKTTPVLFLTARDSINDRVRGLDAGADDYLVKPFSIKELLARVRVMVRSSHGIAITTLTCGDLVMDTASKRVERAGQEIQLSAKEYALLDYLMHNQGQVLSRDRIEKHIWNYDYLGGTNVVDVYISYLRRKVDDGHDVKLIHTVRGQGYVLRAPAGSGALDAGEKPADAEA